MLAPKLEEDSTAALWMDVSAADIWYQSKVTNKPVEYRSSARSMG